MKNLADLFLEAAELVAVGNHAHTTARAAIALTQYPVSDTFTATTAFQFFFEQPKRQYWFGRFDVYEPMKVTHPKDYRKRVREVRRNQKARIHALLLMWAMAHAGDV